MGMYTEIYVNADLKKETPHSLLMTLFLVSFDLLLHTLKERQPELKIGTSFDFLLTNLLRVIFMDHPRQSQTAGFFAPLFH